MARRPTTGATSLPSLVTAVGDIDFKANTLDTVVGAPDTAYVITTDAPWVLDPSTDGFILDSGQLKYVGRRSTLLCIFSVQIEASSNNKDLRVRLFHNNSEVDSMDLSYKTDPKTGSHSKPILLETDDVVDLRVSNQTDTTNVRVINAQLACR